MSTSLLNSDSSLLYVSTALGPTGRISFSSYNTTDGTIDKTTQILASTGINASYSMRWENETHMLFLIGYSTYTKLAQYDTSTDTFGTMYRVSYRQTGFMQGDTRNM